MDFLIHQTTMATVIKPKERQFQVVPVPAIFTRGRWECRDFKEDHNFTTVSTINGENIQILEFQTTTPTTDVPSTIPLMRNDVKNVAQTTNQVVPDILPSAISIDNNMENNITGPSFISQIASNEGDTNKENNNGVSGVAGVNNSGVAIDNKIEQAMDLVKTHLTFAVREEMEQLRTRISELESKVNNLEDENQILRQFAPSEVVTNLPLLIKNAQQQPQQHMPSEGNAE